MKQKPHNDNLVMASIESLFEQASHIDCPPKADLQRHNPKNLPIIGSLPVQLGQEDQGGQLDDIVLTGRLQAPFTDENYSTIVSKMSADEGQDDNPFLAIRQAVIAASEEKNQFLGQTETLAQTGSNRKIGTSEAESTNSLPTGLAEKTFAHQLANLIDSEIERRLAERSPNVQKPRQKKSASGRITEKQKLQSKKINGKKKKVVQNPKQKKTTKPNAKKTSIMKRKEPE